MRLVIEWWIGDMSPDLVDSIPRWLCASEKIVNTLCNIKNDEVRLVIKIPQHKVFRLTHALRTTYPPFTQRCSWATLMDRKRLSIAAQD